MGIIVEQKKTLRHLSTRVREIPREHPEYPARVAALICFVKLAGLNPTGRATWLCSSCQQRYGLIVALILTRGKLAADGRCYLCGDLAEEVAFGEYYERSIHGRPWLEWLAETVTSNQETAE